MGVKSMMEELEKRGFFPVRWRAHERQDMQKIMAVATSGQPGDEPGGISADLPDELILAETDLAGLELLGRSIHGATLLKERRNGFSEKRGQVSLGHPSLATRRRISYVRVCLPATFFP